MCKKPIYILAPLLFLLKVQLVAIAVMPVYDTVVTEYYKGHKLSKPAYKTVFVEDTSPAVMGLRTSYRPKRVLDNIVLDYYRGRDLKRTKSSLTLLDDEAVDVFRGQNLVHCAYKQKIFSEVQKDTEVKVSCIRKISTNHSYYGNVDKVAGRHSIDIGDRATFRVAADIKKAGKLVIREGTVVDAIVGNIVPSSTRGAPAEVVIERFVTVDVNGKKVELVGEVHKRGINMYIPYCLLGYGAYPFTFGASIFLIYLHGGQAVIRPGETFTLLYED